jgi:type II secretory pathway component PulM
VEFQAEAEKSGGRDAVKKYFAQLRPMERRLAVGVAVVLFLVLNWVFIWPHFSDWGNLQRRGDDARRKLKLYQTAISQSANYEPLVKKFESQGESVAPEDQAINMMRTIQSQSLQSGVGIVNYSHSTTRTNEFFTEQVQNINAIATDSQLVDFLYKLGNGASMVRVRDLELQSDSAKQHLNANIRLVASYQKNLAAPAPASAPVTQTPPALAVKTMTSMPTHTLVKTNSKPATTIAK